MSEKTRVVRLLKNESYPTYQLFAVMAKKTPVQKGLRIGVRTVLDWLLSRLGEGAPEELSALAGQEEPLFSYHVSCGYRIDIVHIPEQGTWTLQITEPDLGSEPGNPAQERQPVPGRVITSNIGFCIQGDRLECGFQILMSDPEYAREDAPVYRLAPVRKLMDHREFGLSQVTVLNQRVSEVTTQAGLRSLLSVWHDEQNFLPCVVFTEPEGEADPVPDLNALSQLLTAPGFGSRAAVSLPSAPDRPAEPAMRQPLPASALAEACFSYCRTYRLAGALFERFREGVSGRFGKGDAVILEPDVFGGSIRAIPYTPLKTRQAELIAGLTAEMTAYPRRKPYSFGHVAFLDAAHRHLQDREEEREQKAEETQSEWKQRLALREAELQAKLTKAGEQIDDLNRQISSLKRYESDLEREKEELRGEREKDSRRFLGQLREKDAEIAYLQRKLTRPTEHSEIAEWAARTFPGRILLHQKAVALLEDKSAKTVQASLICDALDYLATDYWDYRYERIPREEMNTRCSEKYGRPFEIKHTGNMTVQYTPSQYKIKYFPGAAGKPVESPLDYHLCVGNDVENLLRIYFLHDDGKKLIVIGSLPRHLRAVTIQ